MKEKINERIADLAKVKLQCIEEIGVTKEKLAQLEANIHALNGGMAELKRLVKIDEEVATNGT